jgi:hypothetical protein
LASGGSGPGSVFRQRILHYSAILIDLDSESHFEVLSNIAVPRVCDAVPGLSIAVPAAMSLGKNSQRLLSATNQTRKELQMER